MPPVQQLVTWSSDFHLDLPEIDDQHRLLADLINKVWQVTVDHHADPARTLTIIEALERYTITHFTQEEVFMREIGFSGFVAHKQAHERFIARISEEKAKVMAGQRLHLDIVHYLKDWLINHILVADREYAVEYARHKAPASRLGLFFKRLFA